MRFKVRGSLPTPAGTVEWYADDVANEREAVAAFRGRYKVAELEKRFGRDVRGITAEPAGPETASAAGPAPPTVSEPAAVPAPPETKAEPSDPTLSQLGIVADVADLLEAGLSTRSRLKAHYAEHGTFADVHGIGPVGSTKILDALKAWKATHPESD